MILTEMCLQVSNRAGGSGAGLWDPPGTLLACVPKCSNVHCIFEPSVLVTPVAAGPGRLGRFPGC